MREPQKLMDLAEFRTRVQERHQLDVSKLEVQFENPVMVYPAEPFENGKFDEEDMQVGKAQMVRDGDSLLGDIELMPHLETFYSAHPQHRPSYMPIGTLVTEGNKAVAIVIQWIKAYVP